MKLTKKSIKRTMRSLLGDVCRKLGYYQCSGCEKWFPAKNLCPTNNGLMDSLCCNPCWQKHSWTTKKTRTGEISEKEIQRVHSEVLSDLRNLQAKQRRDSFKVIRKSK